MTRYFFDVVDDDVLHQDTVGTELKNPEEAGVEATLALAEMALDALPGTKSKHLRMTVRDDGGSPCLSLDLSFELSLKGNDWSGNAAFYRGGRRLRSSPATIGSNRTLSASG